jgi:flagellar protein FlbD
MIKVTGINKKEFVVNAEQIEIIEQVPECVITLISGNKYIVLETWDEVISRVIEYKNRIVFAKV